MAERDWGKLDHLLASPRLTPGSGSLAFTSPVGLGEFKMNLSDHFGWESAFGLSLDAVHPVP
jgi:hypothetical protein